MQFEQLIQVLKENATQYPVKSLLEQLMELHLQQIQRVEHLQGQMESHVWSPSMWKEDKN